MKSRAFIKIFFIALLSAWILAGCNSARRLGKNQFQLKKNVIVCNDKNLNAGDLEGMIRQKPNRKILGVFKFHLSVYNWGNKGKENRLKRWLKNIGEEPVIVDKKASENSSKQIIKQLANKGYFGSTVKDSIVYIIKKKKAVVYYKLNVRPPYKIRNVRYTIEDNSIAQLIKSDTVKSVIIKNQNFDVDVFQAERERITKQMKNEGYYYFSKEYIDFKIDSSLKQHKVDVIVNVLPSLQKSKKPDSLIRSAHKRYFIGDVYVHTEFKPLKKDTIHYDTLIYNDYRYIYPGLLRYNPKALNRLIFVKKGQLYQTSLPDLTYKRISDTKGFKLVGITFVDSNKISNGNNILDCHVLLTPLPAQSYSIELEGTNSAGDLGIAGNLIYQHKNMFKNLLAFHLKVKGAMEFQSSAETNSSDLIQPFLPFNTYEYGIETGLTLPKFLFISPDKISKNAFPKTTLSIGYNFQERTDYWRSITNATMGYTWQESSTKRHAFNPAEINIVNIKKDTSFINIINALNDPQIKNSYEDHLTAASSYTFLFNNQDIKKTKNFSFFSARAEFAGNLMRLLSGQVFNLEKDSLGTYDWFKIKFSQYVKGDVDYRHYFAFSKSNSLVFRIKMGAGIPYGNIHVMPFEKSFFAGGANSIRAWTMKSLGPGSYAGSNSLDKIGDLILETNLEYRFDITSMFKGAFFADGGNIWLLNEDDNRPGANIDAARFLKEFAVGVGLGIRLDFSFFIIRFDAAVKALDPSKPEGDRFVLPDFKFSNINYNLGIGYPF
ncbi:MAG: BamA/TamA family outer membrane protein [Bacteroidota bacterium]